MKFVSLLLSLLFLLAPLFSQGSPPDKWIKHNVTLNHFHNEKHTEAEGWAAKAEATFAESEKKSGKVRIELLKEAGHYLQQIIACYGAVLEKTKTIGDVDYRKTLDKFRQGINENIDKISAQIRQVEANIGILEAEDTALTILRSSEEKEKKASEYISQAAFPTHLKDIDTTITELKNAEGLYQQAKEGFNQVYTLIDRFYSKENKDPFKLAAERCEKLSAECKQKGEDWSVHKQNQIKALKEQLVVVKGNPSQMLPIVQELFDAGVGDEKTLMTLLKEVANSQALPKLQEEQKQDEQKIAEEPFFEREKKRREAFFNHLPLLAQTSNHLSILQHLLTKTAPFALQLDETTPLVGQFHRLLLQTPTTANHFVIKIYDGDKFLYTEKIALPLSGTTGWEKYLIDDGMVSIPETMLKTKYQIDLRTTSLSNGAFLIRLKSHFPYKVTFYFEGNELYSTKFHEPSPWQLASLQKTFPPSSKPIKSTPPICYNSPISYARVKRGDELTRHSVLDQFVKELKNDPLAIAQYVQNEIELVDPLLTRDQEGFFQASPLHKSAAGTFLEGEGGPWEQCALLVYLLREAGFTAIYGQSKLALPTEYVERLLFTQLEGQEHTVLHYPFVLLKDGDRWIYLFPWMKNIQVKEGADLYGLMPKEYASANRWLQRYLSNDENILKHIGPEHNDTAFVLFIKCVEEQIHKQGLTLEDVGTHRSIIKQPFASWEAFPRPEVGLFEVTENLSPKLLAYLEIEISSAENPDKKVKENWSLPALNGRAISIHFEPIRDGHHLVLKLQNEKGQDLSYQRFPLNSEDQILNMKVTYKAGEREQIKNVTFVKGTQAAVCFCFGNGSEKMTSLFAERYLQKDNTGDKIDQFLAFVGAQYFEKCCKAQKLLATLHKVPPVIYFDFGLAKLSPDTSNGPIIGEPDLKFPQVDMMFFGNKPYISPLLQQTQSSNFTDYVALITADVSSNEHQILHDVFQDPYAISTVKLLQIAHDEHQRKGLKGTGFLALTEKTHTEATAAPDIAKLLHFAHLPDLNIRKILALGKGQWEAAGAVLKNDDHSVAYVTPGPVSSLNPLPSYTGMGSLILGRNLTQALISDSLRIMHGGFGSQIPSSFIPTLKKAEWSTLAVALNNPPFSLTKLQPFPATDHKEILGDWLKPDVRPGHKALSNLVSDPVDVVTGAFYVDEVDLTLPGPFPLTIRRNYNSQNPIPGLFGCGWKLGLNPQLVEEDDKLYASEVDGTVIVYRYHPEKSKWIVLPEDNPDLQNFNKRGIGSMANPFNAFIENQNEFILYGSDGSKRVFENYLLKKWINSAGHTLSFLYTDGQLTRIESSNGSYIGFHYNYRGTISEAYAKDGRRICYSYNSFGDLVKVVLPNSAEISYEYDLSHRLTSETRPHGKVLENSYDEKGRVISQRSPVGPAQKMATSAIFAYLDGITHVTDSSGASTTYKIYEKQIYKITDPEGHVTLQSWFIDDSSYFDAEKECIIASFDGAVGYPRSLKSTQDKRGLVTEYRYDEKGNPIEITLIGEDLTGNGDRRISKFLTYNIDNLITEEKAANKATLTRYDKTHHFLPKRVEHTSDQKLISFSEFEYVNGLLHTENHNRAVTYWSYDNRGFPLESIQLTGTNDLEVVTTYRYNEQGQCIEKKTSDGIEQNVYDIMGNRLQHRLLSLDGQVLVATCCGYNHNNQIAWQQGSDPHNVLYLDYNSDGLLKASRQSLTHVKGKNIEPTGFAYRLFDYDSRGHLIEEVNPLGHCTYREYDPLGRLSKETLDELTTHFEYEAGGLLSSITSPTGAKTTRLYTTNGLLKKEIYPDGTEGSFVYDFFGRPVLESKNGITWETHYNDVQNKVTRVQKESGITETRTFDSRGNLLTFTDGEGYRWEKSYDHLNRIKAETDPEGRATTWNYKDDSIVCMLPSGEKIFQWFDAGFLVETQTLDIQGRLLAHKLIQYTPEFSKVEETSGEVVSTVWSNTEGQPLLIQEGDLITTHHYDPAGRCIASVDGEGKITHRQYDHLGRLTHQILPDGATLKFSYDGDSHLTAYQLPDHVSWKATYDSMGRKTGEALHANGQTSEKWEYIYENGLLTLTIDPLGRLHHYTYDAAARLIREQIEQWSRSFTYDQRGFLTSAEQYGQDHSLVKRAYSPSGNLILEEISLNGQLHQQTHQHWTPSSRSLQIGDHRREFRYEAGQLKKLSTQSLELTYDYTLDRSLAKQTTPFYTTTLTYNSSALPKTRTTQHPEGIYKEMLNWNPSGKLSSYQSDTQQTFSYTPRGYLENRYTFNARGIRTKALHHITHSLDPFGKVLTESIDDKLFATTYDLLGQTTSRISQTEKEQFEWDPWGNLISVATASFTWEASYDALGRRLQTVHTPKAWLWSSSARTTSLFDPEDEFKEIGLQINNKTFWKLYGPTSCDALIDNSGNTLGLLHNALGNLQAILAPTRTHWIEELPSPYGPTGPPPPSHTDLLNFAKSLNWQGHRQDPTGFIHLGARHYDPRTGRFLSPDRSTSPTQMDVISGKTGPEDRIM